MKLKKSVLAPICIAAALIVRGATVAEAGSSSYHAGATGPGGGQVTPTTTASRY